VIEAAVEFKDLGLGGLLPKPITKPSIERRGLIHSRSSVE
jgi:hypothetical protein